MVRSIEQEIRDLHELFGSSRDPEGLAFVPLADAYRRSGDTTRALVLLTDGRARHPDLPAASLVEGLVRRDLGDDEGAEEAFRRVLELDPDNARALVGLGRVLTRRRSDDPEGEALLRRGLVLDPGLDEEVRAPDPEPSSPTDEGVVAPADVEPWADVDSWVDVDGEPAGAEEETGIDLAMPVSPEEEAGPTEELHIQWDAEAAFEPFDGGLYGAPAEFGDALPIEGEGAGEVSTDDAVENASGDPVEAVVGEAVSDEAAADDAVLEEAGVDWAGGDEEDGAVEATPEVGSLPTGEVAPEELLMELSDLAPDLEPGLPPSEDDDEEVLPTRTLAELYVRQGLLGEAVQVYEELVDRSPDDRGLQARLEELRAEFPGNRRSAGGEAGSPAGPSAREFLSRLLAWQPGGESDGPDVG